MNVLSLFDGMSCGQIALNIGILDSKRYHALGNGWTVDVIVEFFKNIKI